MIKTDFQEINERVEMIVDLYESLDSAREHNIRTDTNKQQPLQRTGSECVKNRSHRSVVVCLVVLCVLLLTAVIVLHVLSHTNNHQFNINIKNLTEERDQLLTNNINLTKQNEQLNQEINEVWKCLNGKDGWKYYQFNCYFISSELKNWTESRRYCRERGADLIIINNKQEQDIIKQISGTQTLWIGLTDSDEEGRWKWVDGSTLNSRYWRSGQPNGQTRENCAATYSSWWNDYPCNYTLTWMCKKKKQ